MNRNKKIIKLKKYYVKRIIKEWNKALHDALKEAKEVNKDGFKK